jgi:GNAT superfamily N-acetyltransferase
MSLKIRKATSNDSALILEFVKALAEYEKLSHEVTTDAENLRKNIFADPAVAFVLIAESDGKPAGFALFFYNFSTFLGQKGIYLEDLFVKPEFRGAGIGKALLKELARIALSENCGRLDWSVLDWNTPAIEFYKSIGAVAMDEWTTYRMTTAAMQKFTS